ncbi:MAG: hypothetical protein M1816_007089 [Peltula sp. TS41687]|nr:MAG: hypothetical protein M1816_007089 [Peltula sp. TS41687]
MSSDETAPSSLSPSTPSPAATPTPNSLKRPNRKSTLTQQQKNQKRQRATQEQLATLEVEFNKNPTPTAAVREKIAQEINMTERSVQIWFQNRRAKIKLLAKKSIETGEDCDAIPESMRQYLAIQAIESGKPLRQALPIRTGAGLGAYGNGDMLTGRDQTRDGKVVINHFTCRSLSIGTWRRVAQNALDLIVFYSPEKACITYYINNDSAGYKIEFPFSYIRNISLDAGEMGPNGQLSPQPQRQTGLLIELIRPPNFFMDSSGSGGFYQCGDFTEDQQASKMLVHHLGGHPKILSGQLATLVSLEAFQNRHGVYDPAGGLCASAPVSPGLHRPASQPNHITHPHMNLFNDRHFASHLHPNRGHKRQRSRSVPLAVDFAALQQTMPSFHFQHEHAIHSPIFAPVPQHRPPPGPPPGFGPTGSNLRIDTSSNYGLDFRHYPLSAATTTSPSDYASPAMFSTAPSDSMPPLGMGTPYALPFLSPIMDHPTMTDAASSMSAMSSGDPVIANQSPPLAAIDRSVSAELFPMSTDPSGMTDESMTLSELYSKQSLSLPMPSPGMDTTSDELAMHNMITFDTIDPSRLTPEESCL